MRNGEIVEKCYSQILPSRFDEVCLQETHRAYGMDYPDYESYDTLQASRQTFGNTLPNHQLQTVALACLRHLYRRGFGRDRRR